MNSVTKTYCELLQKSQDGDGLVQELNLFLRLTVSVKGLSIVCSDPIWISLRISSCSDWRPLPKREVGGGYWVYEIPNVEDNFKLEFQFQFPPAPPI